MSDAGILRITANTESRLRAINQMERLGNRKGGNKKNEPVRHFRHLTTATAHAHIPCHHTRHFVRSCRPTTALHFLFPRRTRWRRSRGKRQPADCRHRLSRGHCRHQPSLPFGSSTPVSQLGVFFPPSSLGLALLGEAQAYSSAASLPTLASRPCRQGN